MRATRRSLILGGAALLPGVARAQYDVRDGLLPRSSRDDALALPLHTVTICTADLALSKLFYVDGFGLTLEGPLTASPRVKAAQRRLWGMPADIGWTQYALTRRIDGVGEAIRIRLLVLDRVTPSILSSWEQRQAGPFSLGFPTWDAAAASRRLRKLGFGARNALELYNIPRTDGTPYTIAEEIFDGPDFLHGINILRGGNMTPLGVVDPKTLQGGPGYSALVGDTTALLPFFTDVLGLDVRSDRPFPSSPEGAMGNIPGTVFRFTIVQAKGFGPGGHLLFVDFIAPAGVGQKPPGAPPRPPNRGMGAWTFPVRDLDRVMANAARTKTQVIAAPMALDSPDLGAVRVATLLAPNGFLVEAFQPRL